MAKDSKAKTIKPKTSLRQRNQKAAEAKDKPKRVRKAAKSAVKPFSKINSFLNSEYHLLSQSDKAGFFTKSRRITPSYFVESIAELKNVTWPKRKETWELVFAVFVFAIIIGAMISVLDFGLERVFRKIIL